MLVYFGSRSLQDVATAARWCVQYNSENRAVAQNCNRRLFGVGSRDFSNFAAALPLG